MSYTAPISHEERIRLEANAKKKEKATDVAEVKKEAPKKASSKKKS